MGFLKTKGNKILDPENKEIFLRGFCVGGWLMQENFITGFPGTEQELRSKLKEICGVERYNFFFKKFLDFFITEDDISFMKKMGVTGIRVPFNYRHFEKEPGKWEKDGFFYLDRIIKLCKKYGIYVILDMHSVPGYQNRDWHSDNYLGEMFFWKDNIYHERFFGLWEFISQHYKDEEIVAGYDLMNEPVADTEEFKKVFNYVYKETVKRIRKIDKNHIIFLKGNMWGQDFSSFEPPFDENLVYSSHLYAPEMGFGKYPSEVSNRSIFEKEMDKRDEFTRKYNVPMWVGEFGCVFFDLEDKKGKVQLLTDQISIFNERGYSWTIWSYKDIGVMGTRYLSPGSLWMKFTSEMREEKIKFGIDAFRNPPSLKINELIKEISSLAPKEDSGKIGPEIKRIFPKFILEKFALKVSGSSEKEIKNVLSSFLFENFIQREGLEELLSKCMQKDGR